MSVEGNAATILVAAGQRYEIKLLGEGGPGCDGATFARLQARNVTRKLSIDHRHLAVLDNKDLWGQRKDSESTLYNFAPPPLLQAFCTLIFLTALRELLVTMTLAETFSPW